MNRKRWHNAALCSLAWVLCACSGSAAATPSAVATQVALVATVTEVIVSASLTATVTAAPTTTATASATASASATATATDSATPKPSSTPTRTPSPRPTRLPATWTFTPTATDSLPDAPLYPKTPIVAWDTATFIQSVTDSRVSLHDYYDYHGHLMTGGTGSCDRYWGTYAIWEKQPGFTNVPGDWYPLYLQWRQVLQAARTATQPITDVCLHGGGDVKPADDQNILATLSAGYNALDQIRAAAIAKAP